MRLNVEALETRENPATFNPMAARAAFNDLVANVSAVLSVATPPSAASVQNLVMTTVVAVADKVVTPTEQMQIFQAASTVLAEAHVPVERLVAIVMDVQAIRASLG